jgi:hypothetical protein
VTRPDDAFPAADAEDRRAALAAATEVAAHRGDVGFSEGHPLHWLHLAAAAYQWLRDRSTLHAVSVQLIPGTPYKEGTTVTTTFTLDDTDEVVFSLIGADAKGAAVPLPSGFTAS